MKFRASGVEQRIRALSLPMAAERLISTALATLHVAKGGRVWGVQPTTFAEEVDFYRAQHQAQQLRGPRPTLRSRIDATVAEDSALRLKAAADFMQMAAEATAETSPILLHYGAAHATGVYSRAFFSWQHDSRTHGLAVTHRPGDLGKTEVRFETTGHFQRLAGASFLLTGSPTPYGELYTYAGAAAADTSPGAPFERFAQTSTGLRPTSTTLDDLLTMDLAAAVERVRSHCGLHKWRGLPTTLFLYDFLLIFLASSVARYDVRGWQSVLEGRRNEYRLRFDAAAERFLAFGLHYVAYSVSEPSTFWLEQKQAPGSPYTDWEMASAVVR